MRLLKSKKKTHKKKNSFFSYVLDRLKSIFNTVKKNSNGHLYMHTYSSSSGFAKAIKKGVNYTLSI